MKYFKLIFALTILLTFNYSCSDFDDLNDDPNAATKVDPSALLSYAEFQLFDEIHGRTMNAEWGMLMVQYWAQNEYCEESRYDVTEDTFDSSWSLLYTDVLKELETAKSLIDLQDIAEPVKINQKNIIDVLKVHTFMILTDGFGDIPYSQALNIEYDLPGYDSQELVYNSMLSTLSSAASSYDLNSPSFAKGDIIYNGDVAKWKKYTHSLLLRLAMRIVDADPSTASTYITAASTDLISSLSEEAIFNFDSTPDRANPLWRDVVQNSRDDFCVSELLVTTLSSKSDPRLDKFSKETTTGSIVGMPYGLTDNEATLLKPTTSRPDESLRQTTSPSVIFSLAEVQFLLAEAYERGILSGSAESAYANAIKASMNYWGITDDSAINSYISSQPYNSSNWKESIGMQKWIALYMNGYEAWAEWRRLDYPQLVVPSAAVETSIPTKLPYPRSEVSNNSASLGKVSTTPGSIVKKVWWDIN